MHAEQIRKMATAAANQVADVAIENARADRLFQSNMLAIWGEVAAQLAELNENILREKIAEQLTMLNQRMDTALFHMGER